MMTSTKLIETPPDIMTEQQTERVFSLLRIDLIR